MEIRLLTSAATKFMVPMRDALFFNDRTGLLTVRATLPELDVIEQAIEVLNTAPAQVRIEAKLVEITAEDYKALGLDWFFGKYDHE